MHVATYYYDMKSNKTYSNYNLFLNSIGNFEDRIKNLYFLYSAVVKAVYRAKPLLTSYNYDTGLGDAEDQMTVELV